MNAHRRLVAFAVLALAAAALSPAESAEELLNAARRASGAPPLAVDPILTAAAADYAAALAKAGALAHRDAAGRSAAERVREVGGTLSRVGEVLGAGPGVQAVVAAWRKSGAHRAVMLRTEWTHVGMATAPRGETLVVVALFARRLHDEVAIRSAGDAVVLCGRSLAPGTPVALTLSRMYRPTRLDKATGRWEMRFPSGSVPLTLRLGLRRPDGTVEIAHVVYPRAAASRSGHP